MRLTADHRSFLARIAVVFAVVTPSLGAVTIAAAQPPPAPLTTKTDFQIPVTFVSACVTVGFRCWVPNELATITPSATTGAAGVVTFTSPQASTIARGGADCIDVSIDWLNLVTGASGNTVLRAVQPDSVRPIPVDERCLYTPTTVATGSGTVVATANVLSHAYISGWPQLPVHPGALYVLVP
ncbi:hypothetical protein [Rhodococcus triatomae]